MPRGGAKGAVPAEAVCHSPRKGRSSPASAQHRAVPGGARTPSVSLSFLSSGPRLHCSQVRVTSNLHV